MPGEGERWKQEFTDDPDHAKAIEEYVPASRLEAMEAAAHLDAEELTEKLEAAESALTEALDAMDKHVEHPYTSNPQLGRVAARIRSQIEGSNE